MLEWNESTLDTKNDVSNTLFEIYKYFFDTKEVEFSMLLFSDYCKCLKKTYQWFYSLKWSESTDNLSNQFFSCLNIFEELVKISLYPEYIDRNHEIFSTLAEKTVHAITTYINAKPSFENMISTMLIVVDHGHHGLAVHGVQIGELIRIEKRGINVVLQGLFEGDAHQPRSFTRMVVASAAAAATA